MDEKIPDLSYLIELMKKKSGIVFTKEKSYIMITKLYPLLEKYSFASIEDLVTSVKVSNNNELINDIIDHLTTNETSFFRDRYPFEALNKIFLPEIIAKNSEKRTLRILCAACSTGQEPYSLAMSILESQLRDLNFRITAVDIASNVIERAKLGIFNQFEVQRGLPITFLVKYFVQVDKNWQIKPEVKNLVEFKTFNLLETMNSLGVFDLILCRNVLIYFEQELRERIIANLCNIMHREAVLVLGGTEFLSKANENLEKIEEYSGFYRKK